MTDEPEVLRELWEITEMRDGCVFRTRYVRDVWVPMSWRDRCPLADHLFASKSTSYDGRTIRWATGDVWDGQ